MADRRLAATATAQLPVRDARGVLSLRRARERRSRALPGVACARHAVRGAGGAAVTHSIWKPGDFTIGAQCCNCSAMSAAKSGGDPPVGSKPTLTYWRAAQPT